MIKKVYSFLLGLKIGQIIYEPDLPFIVGNISHFLPTEMWTEKEKKELRFCYKEYMWTGFEWEFTRRIEVSK